MYGIHWHETSAHGSHETAGAAPSTVAHPAATPPVDPPEVLHGGITRRDLLLISAGTVTVGALLHRTLFEVHPVAIVTDIAHSLAEMPKPPANAKLSLLLVQNQPTEKNPSGLSRRLRDHFGDSVSIDEAGRSPDNRESRKWLEAHASARAVIFVEETEHLDNSLRVRMRIMARGDKVARDATQYEINAALQALDELLLESHSAIVNDRELMLRTRTDITFPRQPEADPSVEQLRAVARVPSYLQDCQLNLHIVDGELFSGRPLEAAEHLSWMMKTLPVAKSGPDFAGAVAYRQLLIDSEFARRYRDDTTRMRHHQNLAIKGCEHAADLKPQGKYFPVTIAQLANMYPRQPDSELTVAKLKKLEDHLRDALIQVAHSEDPTGVKSDLYMKLNAWKDPVRTRRLKIESAQKAPIRKAKPYSKRRQARQGKTPASRRKTWSSRPAEQQTAMQATMAAAIASLAHTA
jgi:hypothetical protein